MSSQGPFAPTAAANVAQTGNAWTNVANAEGSSSFATCVLPLGGNTIGDFISLTGFGFSIPAGATINGYTVSVNGKYTGTAISGVVIDFSAQLTTNGTTPVGTNKAPGQSIGTVANVLTYGGSADLWGNSFTVSQVNGANFGVMLSYADTDANSLTANINTVLMTINYTTSSGSTFVAWATSNDPKAPPKRAQYSEVAQKVQPSPISQTDWYAFNKPEVVPAPLRAQYSFVAQEIQPSPISQIDWYAFFDPGVKPAPLRTPYTFIAQEIQPSPIKQINWYPVYDPSVQPWKARAQHSYFAQRLATPLTFNNWWPVYDNTVEPPLKAAQFSMFAEVLPAPISILNFKAINAAEVKAPPTNNPNFVTPPIPAITTTFTPISWYPAYAAEAPKTPPAPPPVVSQLLPIPIIPDNWWPIYPDNVNSAPSTARFCTVVAPFQIIVSPPIPPVPVPSFQVGKAMYRVIKKKYHIKPYHVDWEKLDKQRSDELKTFVRGFFEETEGIEPELADADGDPKESVVKHVKLAEEDHLELVMLLTS